MTTLKYLVLGILAAALGALFWYTSVDAAWQKPVDALAAYDYGHDRTQILALHAYLNAQKASDRVPVEKALIRLLEKPDLPAGAKDETCRFLAMIGTERSFPILERTALDPTAGFLAISALMDIPGSAATLQKAFAEAPEKNQEAILGALGRLRDAGTVPQLIEAAKGNGPVAEAALTALGAVGTGDALRGLGAVSPPDDPRLVAAWAKLNGAARLLGDDPSAKSQVSVVFRELLVSPAGGSVRVAAATGLARTDGAEAIGILIPLLTDADLRVRAGVAAVLPALPGSGSALIAAWPGLDPSVQLVVISACAKSSGPDAEQILRHALGLTDGSLQIAVIQAFGARESASAIDDLLPLLNAGGEPSVAAAESLARIPGPEAAEKLWAAWASSSGPAKAMLLAIAANRLDREAWNDAISGTSDPDAAARAAAFRAVGLLAGPADLPAVIALLPNIQDPVDRASWTKTLLAASRNNPDPDAAAGVLNGALASASPEARPAFLLALAGLSSPQATASLHAMLQSPNIEERKEVIRTLSSVRNSSSLEILLAAAKTGQDPAEKILALRGYLDGLKAQTDAAPESLAKSYAEAWTLAERQQERDAILASLKALKGAAAKKYFDQLSASPAPGGNS